MRFYRIVVRYSQYNYDVGFRCTVLVSYIQYMRTLKWLKDKKSQKKAYKGETLTYVGVSKVFGTYRI